MKNTYSITASDIKGKALDHLPITLKTKFRSFERACKRAKRLHKENRSVIIVEQNKLGMVATWEMETGYDLVVFNAKSKIYISALSLISHN